MLLEIILLEVDIMDCDKCIYGIHFPTCNADWTEEEYEKMAESDECKYFEEGNRLYNEQKCR